MTIGKDRAVHRQLRTLFNVGTIRDLTDGQLLERFATSGDEAAELAFAVLIERHGPMVLRVCRGVLLDPADREDAFQATFLVLVKKARALWVRDSLGPWLHQVAYRTASCARSAAARRRRHERRAAMLKPEGRQEVGNDLGRIIHDEIDRLPERYRAPVVLCDLEGRSHEQAARHLGWPVGTVKSRQARGRQRLRDRLGRRGVAPGAGLLATALHADSALTLVPHALVQATTSAVARFAATRTILRGSATALAQGVLRSMFMTQYLKVTSVAFALCATVSGVGFLAQQGTAGGEPGAQVSFQGGRAYDGPVHEVTPGKLTVDVVERGIVEAVRKQVAFSLVEGPTTIKLIKPDGSRVKKGEVVCELDSARLNDQLQKQMTAVQRAETDYQNAKLTLEVAEITLTEYVEGIYKQDQSTVKGEIVTAKTAIRRAEARLERTRRAHKRIKDSLTANRAAITPADIVAELDIEDRLDAAEQAVRHEQMGLEVAQTKLTVLEKYTLDKTKKDLKNEIEKARADLVAKQATLQVEKDKEAKLKRQMAACTMVANRDGLLVYADDSRFTRKSAIEQGAMVRERQLIFQVDDLDGPMQVNAKVRESMVDQLKLGNQVRIKVDAFPGEVLTGLVSDVAPLPDASSYFDPDRKVYSTRVKIGAAPAALLRGLRPGMTADVEILVADLDSVLALPVDAVIHYAGAYRVAVKQPDGRFDWREVTVGQSNNKLVEIKKGIEPGDHVARNPLALLSADERKRMSTQPDSTTNPRSPGTARGKAERSPDRVDPKNPRGDAPRR